MESVPLLRSIYIYVIDTSLDMIIMLECKSTNYQLSQDYIRAYLQRINSALYPDIEVSAKHAPT